MLPPANVMVKYMTKIHLSVNVSFVVCIPWQSVECCCVVIVGHSYILWVAVDVDILCRYIQYWLLPWHHKIREMAFE